MVTEPAEHVPPELRANLRALAARDRALAERVLLPMDGDHIRIAADGSGSYRHHRAFVPFSVPPEELSASVGELDLERPVLLMGIGLGEQLEHLLCERRARRVIAWERDPWLLRQTLMLRDFSAEIAAGRLELKLGVDLLDFAGRTDGLQVVSHPFFGEVYAEEQRLLASGPGERRALVAVGTLFVDDLSHCLREAGYALLPIDIRRWSLEELEHAVQRFDPQFVASINYTSGLVEFCHRLDRELLVWEIDPATDRVRPPEAPTDRAHLFTYRRRNVASWREAGFRHVEYTPLAANTARRRPVELTPEERSRYEAPVVFVGCSMVEDARALQGRLCESYARWHPAGEAALEELRVLLAELYAIQRADLSRWRLGELLEEHLSAFLAHTRAEPGAEDPIVLAGETAAAERRLSWVAELAPFGVEVWGDPHWRSIERYGARYRGSAAHTGELTRIYNAARVNVDIGRLYQTDIVTMRVFDVLACGGFLIAERSDALEDLFDVGGEVEAFGTLEELKEKVAYFLDHPEAARRIAARGERAVRERHAFQDRVEKMLTRLAG